MALWREKSQSLNKINLEGELAKIPPLIAQLLSARNFSQEEVLDIISPKLSTLKDPFLIQNMDLAVERIVEAYQKKQKICIYADFDLDGASGLAILKLGLEKLGFTDVAFYQPKRLSEGYGFHPHAVEELKLSGIDLIITVDVGITSHAAFAKAREVGVDVILTDHHLPSEVLPDAFCIVNPNQSSDRSGLGYLCGAGVAFYLIRALRRAFTENPELPKHEWDLKELLDLFCIGTITDMVPLIDDNRVLVKHGMMTLQNTQKPGLQALLESLELKNRPLSSQDIGIKFAPKLNALSRMESEILPVHIYLEKSLAQARSIVQKILDNNTTRQTLQQDAEEKSRELLKDWSHEDFIFVCSEDFHRGVIGLIATKLAQEFNRPTFVGSINSEGVIVGSSRLPSGHESSLVEALTSAQECLTRFGGHSAAAGFELHSNKQNKFIELIAHYYHDLKLVTRELEIEYDTRAQIKDLSYQFMKWYDHLGPYGMGFQTPLFCFEDVKIVKRYNLKGGHIKLQFQDVINSDTSVDALIFSPTENLRSQMQVGDVCDVLAEVQWNYFKNKQSIQLLVKDVKYKK